MSLLQLNLNSWSVDKRQILGQLDFELAAGEMVGLIGPNGAGKSSLLKVLANLHQDYLGEYQFLGQQIGSLDPKDIAKQLAYLEQGAPVHWPLLGRRIVELGRLPHQGFSQTLNEQDQAIITAAINKTHIQDFIDRPVNTLSGGERLRVLLARLLASQAKIVLADEPIASLDPFHQIHVMEILRDIAVKDQGGVVVVLHDLNLAARFCDRLVVLDHGHIVANGSVESVLDTDILQQTYDIDLLRFEHEANHVLVPWSRR